MHMEYFHMGIFVIPWVYLIQSENMGPKPRHFFFVFHRFFDTVKYLVAVGIVKLQYRYRNQEALKTIFHFASKLRIQCYQISTSFIKTNNCQ